MRNWYNESQPSNDICKISINVEDKTPTDEQLKKKISLCLRNGVLVSNAFEVDKQWQFKYNYNGLQCRVKKNVKIN